MTGIEIAMRRIEIRDKSTEYLLATYLWDSFEFYYDADFYAENGDWLRLTKGQIGRKFESLPDYFFEFLPEIGSANYNRITKQRGIDRKDIFSYITHDCFKDTPASYYFKGLSY